eukprot:CAMPEP_0196810276 /NCGR_PEP_ID=MMETSP1362-20130617/10096_1 /TAXON_ID=163516 /ORGANISM="Leptocylindrus danicus, Strain CCMP1856" /LENGTH=52 /DNA_ID=CAMNT_0042185197 /DNA_START=51 /DNA_END=210 /DNA_ORIENTATION=-
MAGLWTARPERFAGVKEEDRCVNWKAGVKYPCDNGKPTEAAAKAAEGSCVLN